MTSIQLPVTIDQIRKLLPHRYPFLLIDRIIELEPMQHIRAYKNVSQNEPFFQGHFPDRPIMPGVLIIEALAQAGGMINLLSREVPTMRTFYMAKVEGARFSKMVTPGDRLDLDVTLKRTIRNVAFYHGVATVDGEEVASADVVCAEDNNC
ncbi:3-hydroxyacyl-ACP dehydratase FabZ [Xanthomonas massiliensis]|jgi:3-hydroxyacyl-[acyl-carrier-protein] dehydratase|uniref:3-hydroxyacyl-ACP dehydratase FabZ n=1 Tax=Xanthomonas massiliensis TaxID=1720302 RepID=UPI0008243C93|nr:3-hydroxyacyl-ACP dehydratase FabZ [Xanthomonas massiliensis]